eukprot:688983-Alexandrium_andersonii.AAC.1
MEAANPNSLGVALASLRRLLPQLLPLLPLLAGLANGQAGGADDGLGSGRGKAAASGRVESHRGRRETPSRT